LAAVFDLAAVTGCWLVNPVEESDRLQSISQTETALVYHWF
jgi:hypothetical protein